MDRFYKDENGEKIKVLYKFEDKFLRPMEIYNLAKKHNLENVHFYFEFGKEEFPFNEQNVRFTENTVDIVNFDKSLNPLNIKDFYNLCLENKSENKILNSDFMAWDFISNLDLEIKNGKFVLILA